MADKRISREARDFFGNPQGYTEHFDESGKKIGESREATDLFGNPHGYTEHRDDSGDKAGESREATDFFGNKQGYTEHFDDSGKKTGESREATDLFGNKLGYVEHFDKSGRKTGEMREPTDFLGNKKGYREYTPSNSSESSDGEWDWLIKLVFWLFVIGFVIWLIMMAVAITVILSPLWLGAVSVGVLTGFFLAPRVLVRIPTEAFSEAPVFEQKKGKGTRYRLAEQFFKNEIRFSPDLLCIIGATLLFGLLMAVWPFVTTKDIFTQVLLGIGVLAGAIFGTMSGRRVLCWQLENLLFERANLTNPTRLLSPKVALGFSIPGLIALVGVWVFAIVQSSGQVDFAQAFGFKDTSTSRSTAASGTPGNAVSLPNTSTRIQKPIPTSLGPSVVATAITEGFSIPKGSLSPNGRFGVLVPDQARFRDGVKGQNKLIEVSSGRVLATIDAESWFQDPAVQMNHGAAAARWSHDGSVLAWIVGGKWAPRAFNLLKVSNREVEWQRDILDAAQREILLQTRIADAEAYEAAKAENRGNGATFLDGFTIDMELPDAGFSLPLVCTVTLDSNPKQIEGLRSLRSSIRLTIDEAGQVTFSGMRLHSSPRPSSATESTQGVQDFIQSRLNTEASHDLDRILTNYADRVSYWDNGVVDQDFIRKDKSAYFERWPVTREEIEGPINVSRSGDDWIAKFKTRFRVENPAKGVLIQGIQEATYSLQYSNGAFRIAGENGKVLEKQKFENAPVATSSSQQGNYVGERFPETRTVHLSLQDLQKLSADDLRYAINEMFARYGADFPKEEVKRQFSRFSWYRPRTGLGFDEIENRFFSDLERENLKRLGEARETAGSRGSTVAALPKPGGASLRPSSKSRFVTTRELKKLVGQQVKDTWFYGDFVASSISGNTVIMYPIWGGGFVRGYSTEIRATFANGVPPFPGRERLPMDPIDSTAGIHIDRSQPLRITSVMKSAKPGTSAEIVVVRAEQ